MSDTEPDEERPAWNPVPAFHAPSVYVEGDQRPVVEIQTTSAQEAIDTIIAAERLDLGWVAAGVFSAEVRGESERQFQVTVYRTLRSDIGPTPKEVSS